MSEKNRKDAGKALDKTPGRGARQPAPDVQGGEAMSGSGEGSWTRAGSREGGSATGFEPPDEPATFSQGGGSGSQPGLGKRIATTEDEDEGHLGRSDFAGARPNEGAQDRARGAAKHR
jgi:hypothetical protein